ITARLAPTDAANVCAVIDKDVTMNSTVANTPADAPMGARESPSLGRQRADALVRVTTEPDSGSSAGRTEVVVHVRDTHNTLADGTSLTDHAVTRLLPESFISLLMHDADRRPIDASPHRRFPTKRQPRVLDERFTECAHPGCHAHVILQADHVVAYDDAGPTTIDNLQLHRGRAARRRRPIGTVACSLSRAQRMTTECHYRCDVTAERSHGPHNRAKEHARARSRSARRGSRVLPPVAKV
ncbi:MAG TPA: hypothetical protein VFN21_03325, partial [Acidimicrobiales bacterium]|nr:hypothetical protein [Acidimicrobiales bacterium]